MIIERTENGLKISNNNRSITISKNEKWITVKPNGDDNKGKHLLLKDGETPKEAIDRLYGSQKEEIPTKEKRFVSKDDVKEMQNYIFLTVYCSHGNTEISFDKKDIELSQSGNQYIFDRRLLRKKAVEAVSRANKGNLEGIKGVRNLF